MDCYTAYKRKHQVQLTCTWCEKEFSVSKNRSGSISHCSRKCYVQSANHCGKRICKDCKQAKAIEEFNTHSPAKNIRRRYCKECENKRVKTRSQTAKTRWKHSQGRSAKSGEVWEIPFEQYVEMLKQKCHYCNDDLNLTGCGLDRKDNEVGYIVGNVVPCCRQCNTVKNCFFSYEEMIELATVIRQIKARRNNHAHGK